MRCNLLFLQEIPTPEDTEEPDLVHCILSATRIQKQERDELRQAVHGMKYVILGKDTHGQLFYTAGKVLQKNSRKRFYFYITAHQADENV
jgi:hypothetical protein